MTVLGEGGTYFRGVLAFEGALTFKTLRYDLPVAKNGVIGYCKAKFAFDCINVYLCTADLIKVFPKQSEKVECEH